MKSINMVVGLPSSGKTTFVREMKEEILNRGETYSIINAGEIHNIYPIEGARSTIITLAREDIFSGKFDYIIIDGGFLTRKERRLFFQDKVMGGQTVICNFFAVSYQDCVNNAGENEAKLEELHDAYMGVHVPLLSEGFNNITYMTNTHEIIVSNTKEFLDKLKAGCDFKTFVDYHPFKRWIKGYDQNNPYHSLNLDEHMFKVYEYCMGDSELGLATYSEYVLGVAAAFHDIGKPLCRAEKTPEHSTYYGHENVSAYEAVRVLARSGLPKEAIDDIITIISYHMRPKTEKKREGKMWSKVEKEIGNNNTVRLKFFNQADINSKK